MIPAPLIGQGKGPPKILIQSTTLDGRAWYATGSMSSSFRREPRLAKWAVLSFSDIRRENCVEWFYGSTNIQLRNLSVSLPIPHLSHQHQFGSLSRRSPSSERMEPTKFPPCPRQVTQSGIFSVERTVELKCNIALICKHASKFHSNQGRGLDQCSRHGSFHWKISSFWTPAHYLHFGQGKGVQVAEHCFLCSSSCFGESIFRPTSRTWGILSLTSLPLRSASSPKEVRGRVLSIIVTIKFIRWFFEQTVESSHRCIEIRMERHHPKI